jgi:AMMECR1 domain-containing protein
VASEQEWDKNTTLKHLIRKAGYNKSYENVLDAIKLTTYESSKERLTYLDY